MALEAQGNSLTEKPQNVRVLKEPLISGSF